MNPNDLINSRQTFQNDASKIEDPEYKDTNLYLPNTLSIFIPSFAFTVKMYLISTNGRGGKAH